MRDVLRKILVIALSVGLTASAPALSHAQPGHSGAAASHENHDVQHYADLAIEPGTTAVHKARPGRRMARMTVFAKSAARLVWARV